MTPFAGNAYKHPMNARVDAQPKREPDLLMTSLTREHGFEPLRIEGELPETLNGTLYRVGPGLFETEGRRYGHPFEADGAVCAVRLEGGRATGAHRVVMSNQLVEERAAGTPLYGSVASWPRRVLNGLRLRGKNAANTNLMQWQDNLFALYEASRPTQLSYDLDTLGERDLDGAVLASFSAHPHRVAAHAATYNFGVRYGKTSFIDLYRLPDRGMAQHLASIPLRAPVMLHDFIATERHLIFFVSPSVVRVGRALLGLNPLEELIGWDARRGTEVIVVPLDDPNRPIRFEVDAFYQWHFAGAFESGGELLVDAVIYPNLDTLGALRDGVTNIDGGVLTRVSVDPRARRVAFEPLDDTACEFPRIDPRFEGGAYSRVWVAGTGQLIQHDLETRSARLHPIPSHQFASETVYVPRAPDAPEGDGWVLSLIYDGDSAKSHVAVLDTTRFDDEPVARVWFDHHVPLTFHGIWTSVVT